jgi:elongation factor P
LIPGHPAAHTGRAGTALQRRRRCGERWRGAGTAVGRPGAAANGIFGTMKINGNELRPGNVIEHQDSLWAVVKTQHVKPGKGGAFAQVELKNLLDGRKLNERFRSADTVERVRLEQKDFQYLYEEGDMLVFMDTDTYEQIELAKDFVGERTAFLQDGMTVTVEMYEEKPIGVTFPPQVTLEVAEAEPVVKGQTATSSYKPAVLENGVKVMVPPFVSAGERIVVDTGDISYVRRAD